MYGAKDTGRDRAQLFEDGLRSGSIGRFRSEAMLRHALDHDGLRLHYQPLVNLTTGALAGAEALVRLHHPDRGLIPPAEFIPVAEETGLVVPLGASLVAEATAQAAAGRPGCPLGRGLPPAPPRPAGTSDDPSQRRHPLVAPPTGAPASRTSGAEERRIAGPAQKLMADSSGTQPAQPSTAAANRPRA